MATISSVVEVYDGFSQPLTRFISMVGNTVAATDRLSNTLGNNLDTSGVVRAERAVDLLNESAMNVQSPVITAQADFSRVYENVPQGLDVPVTPHVEEQPKIDLPQGLNIAVRIEIGNIAETQQTISEIAQQSADVTINLETNGDAEAMQRIADIAGLTVDVPVNMTTNGIDESQQRINSITQQLGGLMQMQTAIENIGKKCLVMPEGTIEEINKINDEISILESALEQAVDSPSETVVLQFEAIENSINRVREKQQELNNVMGNIPLQTVQVNVEANTGMEQVEQQIASVDQMLKQLQNSQLDVVGQIQNCKILPSNAAENIQALQNQIISLSENVSRVSTVPIDVNTDSANAGIERIKGTITEIFELENKLGEAIQGADVSKINEAYFQLSQAAEDAQSTVREVFSELNIPPVQIEWETESIGKINGLLQNLNFTQNQIVQKAANTKIFPQQALTDMNNIQQRIQAIQQRIQAIQQRIQAIQQRIQTISANPLNMGTGTENAEMNKLRSQLEAAVQEQNNLNNAVENMDVEAANQAYLKLSQTVNQTERYIGRNSNEQEKFNKKIKNGTDSAEKLKGMIQKAVGAFAGIAGIKKTFDFLMDCFDTFNVQLNAENQLMGVLSNTYNNAFSELEVKLTANASEAIRTIEGIQDNVEAIEIPAYVRTAAANAAFDRLTAKASEIQGRGIYGDEIMIAAAAEFSTYFTDTNAIEMMMDTLTDYAMGMEGGVTAVDVSKMVNYATNLGKMMSGAYDAMTKKGFELSDEQKAIIEGTATQAQIVSTLGEEYIDMSQDMRAAAAISQVIEEGWGGLYENMSNTAAGSLQQMNNAWGDLKETIGEKFAPIIQNVTETIMENWDKIEGVIDKFGDSLVNIAEKMPDILDGATAVFNFVVDNWPAIQTSAESIGIAVLGWRTAHIFLGDAINLSTIAQEGLNAAMEANPIGFVIGMIAALIGICTALDNVIKDNTENIFGMAFVVIAFFNNVGMSIANFFIAINNCITEVRDSIDVFAKAVWNVIPDVLTNIGILFDNMIKDMQIRFLSFKELVLIGLNEVLEKINSLSGVFGITVDTSGINQQIEDTAAKIAEIKGSEREYIDVGAKIRDELNANGIDLGKAWNDGINTFDTFKDGWQDRAFEAGSEFGNLYRQIKDSFNIFDTPYDSYQKILDIINGNNNTDGIVSVALQGALDAANKAQENMSNILGNINDNTSNIADSLSISEEDLKYLKDIAERETINKFTTAEVHIDQSGMQYIINKDTDVDGVIDTMTDKVVEAYFIMDEGVHA